jgi:hypothetical protein
MQDCSRRFVEAEGGAPGFTMFRGFFLSAVVNRTRPPDSLFISATRLRLESAMLIDRANEATGNALIACS